MAVKLEKYVDDDLITTALLFAGYTQADIQTRLGRSGNIRAVLDTLASSNDEATRKKAGLVTGYLNNLGTDHLTKLLTDGAGIDKADAESAVYNAQQETGGTATPTLDRVLYHLGGITGRTKTQAAVDFAAAVRPALQTLGRADSGLMTTRTQYRSGEKPVASPPPNPAGRQMGPQLSEVQRPAGPLAGDVRQADIQAARVPAPAARTSTPTAARGATPAAAGAGAGGGGTVDTTPKLAPGATPAEALAFIREHYGYGAWIFEHPDVADVLTRAAKDGHWSPNKLKGELENTDFFKTHDGNVVTWLNTDVATQKTAVEKTVNTVIGKAQALGMDLDSERARQIATDANMYGWDDTQLTKAVGHEYHYNPTMAQKGIAKQLRDTARLYGIPMTDGGLDEWGRRVGAGDATADDFKATMINQASSLFPTLAEDLKKGVLTVKDIFDPYAKLAATTLGVDESTIDILDPKWQRPLQSTDGKNPTRMSTFDWTRTLRTDATYDFDHTDNARQEAADFAHKLRQGFGLA